MTPHYHASPSPSKEAKGCSPTVWILLAVVGVVVILCGGVVFVGVMAVRSSMRAVTGGPGAPSTRTDVGMSMLWSQSGVDGAVACDSASGEVYVLGLSETVAYDASGAQLRRLPMGSGAMRAAMARLDSDPELEFALVDMGGGVQAWDADGSRLWFVDPPGGASDVCVADLDGDGVDELLAVVESGGVAALDASGGREWFYGAIGDVSCISVGDPDGDGGVETFLVGYTGATLLDAAGSPKAAWPLDHDTPAWTLPEPTASGVTWVTLDGDPGAYTLHGRKPDRTEVWSLALAWDFVWDPVAASCPSAPLLAIASADGDLVVVNTETGAEVASGSDQGYGIRLAWLDRPADSPLLLVSDYTELRAMELMSAPPPTPVAEGSETAESGPESEHYAEKPPATKPTPAPEAESSESAAMESQPKPRSKWVD